MSETPGKTFRTSRFTLNSSIFQLLNPNFIQEGKGLKKSPELSTSSSVLTSVTAGCSFHTKNLKVSVKPSSAFCTTQQFLMKSNYLQIWQHYSEQVLFKHACSVRMFPGSAVRV